MKINRRTFLGTLGTSTMLANCAPAPRAASRPPNIVLILADDLGYGDIGAYGNRVNRTPNLDRLAGAGVRFTDFHSNGPACTPTRAAILTGWYPGRFGPEFEGALSGETHYDIGLPLGTKTIAGVLKEAGYSTAMFGKWHLGYRPPYLPTRYGFDEFRGLTSGDGDHHSHIDRSGRKDWWRNESIEVESGYTAELLTRYSVEFIEKNRRRPFFLYVPHLAIHFPWQGARDRAHRVEGRRYHDLSKLGPLEGKDVGAKIKEMVEALDESVGAISAALDRHGLTENTLVFFTSDNGGYLTYQGGYYNISSNGPLRGQKAEVYEGGHRVPAIASWPGRISPGVSEQTSMTFDLVPTFAELAGVKARLPSLKPDGISLNPVVFDRRPLQPRTLFWRMNQRKAVRRGDWKLVLTGQEKPQLYNLSEDIGESKDRSAAEPELTAALLGELARWEAGLAGI